MENGVELKGWSHFKLDKNDTSSYKPYFSPSKTQDDGSVWVNSEKFNDLNSIPENINVYSQEMAKYTGFGFTFDRDKLKPIEPAVVKILLGYCYWALQQGNDTKSPQILQSESFDPLRRFIKGYPTNCVTIKWLTQLQCPWNNQPITDNRSFISVVCKNNQMVASICLFGKISCRICINSFKSIKWSSKKLFHPYLIRE